jgi:hypothetical protein
VFSVYISSYFTPNFYREISRGMNFKISDGSEFKAGLFCIKNLNNAFDRFFFNLKIVSAYYN